MVTAGTNMLIIAGGGGGASQEVLGSGGGGGSSAAPAGASFASTGTGNGSVNLTWTTGETAAPDAQIRVGDEGPFVGAGVFAPAPQTVTAQVAPGATRELEVRVVNRGDARATFALTGTTERGGFTARYFDDDDEVTDEVRGGTYATPALAGGASHTITMRVMAPSAAPATATFEFVASDSSGLDRVAADVSTRTGAPLARTGADGNRLMPWALALIRSGVVIVLLGLPHRRPEQG
jgi:hypothetical protein